MINILQKMYMYKPIFFVIFHTKKYGAIVMFLLLLITCIYFLYGVILQYPIKEYRDSIDLMQAIGTVLVPLVALGATYYIARKQYQLEKERTALEFEKTLNDIFQNSNKIINSKAINLDLNNDGSIDWNDISKQFTDISREILNEQVNSHIAKVQNLEESIACATNITQIISLEVSTYDRTYNEKHFDALFERWVEFYSHIALTGFMVDMAKHKNLRWREEYDMAVLKNNLHKVLHNFKVNTYEKETAAQMLYDIELNLLDERLLS